MILYFVAGVLIMTGCVSTGANKPHSRPGPSLIIGSGKFAWQHEYLLFCQIEHDLSTMVAGQSRSSPTAAPKRIMKRIRQLNRCLERKMVRVEQWPEKRLAATIQAILRLYFAQAGGGLAITEAGPHFVAEVCSRLHHLFQALACLDLVQENTLAVNDRELIAREMVARCFTDLFRWTVAARQQLRPEFIALERPRGDYLRSISGNLCLRHEPVLNGHHLFSGRIIDAGSQCPSGIYFELDLKEQGELDRILFELD